MCVQLDIVCVSSLLSVCLDEKQFEVASRLSAAVVRPQNCSFIWGLPAVVSMVNAAEIWRYLWLLKDITPNPEKHQLPEDYTVSSRGYF